MRPSRQKRARSARTRSSWAGRFVLGKVNSEPRSASVKRVLWLLEALRDAETLRIQLYEATEALRDSLPVMQCDEEGRISFADAEVETKNLQFQKLIREIEHRLKRYRWTPTIDHVEFAALHQSYVWPRKSEQWENVAVEYLLRMAGRGGFGRTPSEIRRLRRCRQCQKWFYATTEHQTSCSHRCRNISHSESPEAKARHATYMREIYRPLKKALGDSEGRRDRQRKAMKGA
jgi:hypothetical protein